MYNWNLSPELKIRLEYIKNNTKQIQKELEKIDKPNKSNQALNKIRPPIKFKV